MKIKVGQHKIEILKEPINEKEIDITKCEFEFDEEITDDFVKDAYFTFNGTTYKQIITNNECDIPYEVLSQKGQVEIGVVCYKLEDETEIKRFNPSPAYFNTWVGSLKEDYENTEPITPSDKEQIEQIVTEVQTQMNNLDIDAEKVEHTTTVTITKKDGTEKTVQIFDGDKGDKGDKGDAGAIKMIIVQTLPTENIDANAIYLVPLENPTEEGNNYAEYIYVNNQWELLGKIGVQVDLTNYVTNTDYASSSTGGVIKTNSDLGVSVNNGFLRSVEKTYTQYGNMSNNAFVSKGTLENVITGKGLVSNTDYATSSTGGVILAEKNGFLLNNGSPNAGVYNYTTYQAWSNGLFISKGTLENVLTERIGNIQTLLDTLNNGNGV